MKRTVPVIIGCVLVAYSALQVMAALVTVTPVEIHFGPPRIVFVRDVSAHKTAEITERKFMLREFVLDTTASEKGKVIWCKRAVEGGYQDVFRQAEISEDVLLNMSHASEAELTGLLGEPVFSEGPMDFEGTVICEWRTYNGRPGEKSAALQVAAGFAAGAKTNALFLIVCSMRLK